MRGIVCVGGNGPRAFPFLRRCVADDIAVAAAHYWSTDVLVFSEGDVYYTLGGPGCCNRNPGDYFTTGWITQSGSSYDVNYCNAQILITSE